MIFDMRRLEEIEDAEVETFLDQGVSERIDAEYKVRLNHRDNEERAELLRDISSFANARGGYLFVGVSADQYGRPTGVAGLSVDEALNLRQSIAALVHNHIEEQLLDFDIQEKRVDGKIILIARIAESDQKPHMVTISNRTEFCIRVADGKRAMSYAEIRESFRGDQTSRRLSNIEVAIQRLSAVKERESLRERIRGGAVPVSEITDGQLLDDALTDRFLDSLQ